LVTPQKVHALHDGLQHSELYTVVDELDEVPCTRSACVDVAAVGRKGSQNGLDPRHWILIAADHKAGTIECAIRPPGVPTSTK
jgi:hypothetical protein